MARPLRIEYPGAVYHIMSRGNDKQAIFLNVFDYLSFFEILSDVVKKYNWLCHSYCLMDNHYHLLIETIDPTLSMGMRQLNGVYTQSFNRRNDRVGHIFQGRYKSIIVEKNEHLLELCKYIVLNPTRAGLTADPGKWKWSSYQALAGSVKPPVFLTTNWILDQFGETKSIARKRYQESVVEGLSVSNAPWGRVVGQLIFGGEEFVADIQDRLKKSQDIGEITRTQRFAGRLALADLFPNTLVGDKSYRNSMIEKAHLQHGYKLKEIGEYLEIHYATVSRVIKRCKSDNSRPDPGT